MTRDEAIAVMQKGKKVTHPLFTQEEWMTMNNKGEIELEDGVVCEPHEFWRYRYLPMWDNGYKLFEDY